ncbi:hypothetical protein J1605_021635 [Eschrichtius robustus]|uniref:Uncharacterized protein n=1 Tax=Eschrichtius robustus TaxID=9764 RepID=A0AB34HFK2_ESCRO|nr:hypothetical protein J1605_021635 [Eschrichtius robustus]
MGGKRGESESQKPREVNISRRESRGKPPPTLPVAPAGAGSPTQPRLLRAPGADTGRGHTPPRPSARGHVICQFAEIGGEDGRWLSLLTAPAAKRALSARAVDAVLGPGSETVGVVVGGEGPWWGV